MEFNTEDNSYLLEKINSNPELQEIVLNYLESGEILFTEQLYFKDQIGKEIEDIIDYYSSDQGVPES